MAMLHSLLRLGSHYRDLNHTAFRKTATRLTAAAMMLGGLAVSARADDAASNFAAACASIKNEADRAGCMIDAINKHAAQMKKETAASRQESATARQESAAARAVGATADKELRSIAQSEVCFDFLKKGRDGGKFTRESVLEAAGGKLTPDNSCTVARKFGFDQRASVDAPRMQ